ncbi:MAG: hypothetical protein VYC39_02785 [Myxococcota bacterium]|nr:hypothetical protein [Myxococcota bacterium]
MLEGLNVTVVEIASAPVPFDQAMYDLAQKCLDQWPQGKQRKYFTKWMKNALETVQAYDPTCERGAAPRPNEPYDHRYTFKYQCSQTELTQILEAITFTGS